jgi:hypothetical protein
MVKYLRISSNIRKPFVIYDFVTDPISISLYVRKLFFSFLSVHEKNCLSFSSVYCTVSDLFVQNTYCIQRSIYYLSVHKKEPFARPPRPLLQFDARGPGRERMPRRGISRSQDCLLYDTGPADAMPTAGHRILP